MVNEGKSSVKLYNYVASKLNESPENIAVFEDISTNLDGSDPLLIKSTNPCASSSPKFPSIITDYIDKKEMDALKKLERD